MPRPAARRRPRRFHHPPQHPSICLCSCGSPRVHLKATSGLGGFERVYELSAASSATRHQHPPQPRVHLGWRCTQAYATTPNMMALTEALDRREGRSAASAAARRSRIQGTPIDLTPPWAPGHPCMAGWRQGHGLGFQNNLSQAETAAAAMAAVGLGCRRRPTRRSSAFNEASSRRFEANLIQAHLCCWIPGGESRHRPRGPSQQAGALVERFELFIAARKRPTALQRGLKTIPRTAAGG